MAPKVDYAVDDLALHGGSQEDAHNTDDSRKRVNDRERRPEPTTAEMRAEWARIREEKQAK